MENIKDKIPKEIKDILYSDEIIDKEKQQIIFKYYEKIKKGKNKNLALEIKNQIAIKNMKLVASIAKQYSHYNMEFDDLINSGFLGLYEAIDKFDYKFDNSFSTYAIWWIKNKIQRFIQYNYSQLNISYKNIEKLIQLKSIQNQYQKENKDLTDDILLKKLKISKKKLKDLKEIEYYSITPSLNKRIGEIDHGEWQELQDFITNETNFEEDVMYDIDKEKLLQFIKNIIKDERSLDIILNRCGFYGKCYTLEELGQKYGVSRERIRQIENKTLKKLREPKNMKILNQYYGYLDYSN